LPSRRGGEEKARGPDPSSSRTRDPLDVAISTEELARIRERFGELGPTGAEVLTIRYVEKLTTGEIADLLGLTEGAVHTRLSRARSRLQALLAE
jgi:RNA polymerase sigma factor (sigma-70 family)